jgi:hypothetical protein
MVAPLLILSAQPPFPEAQNPGNGLQFCLLTVFSVDHTVINTMKSKPLLNAGKQTVFRIIALDFCQDRTVHSLA